MDEQPPSHYFRPTEGLGSRRQTVRLALADQTLELSTDRGVFSAGRVDPGTGLLLSRAPAPPQEGSILDLGCGYGPVAIAVAKRAAGARVWAIDVNERALELTRANALALGVENVTALKPDEVPAELLFDAIYSNPPIRIGKQQLHEILLHWLGRLTPDGRAYLVVQKHLGSDSLARWLDESGFPTERLATKSAYRVLAVGPARTGPTPH
jgi:16S rRNA (guanine1207-N2)-methyltransferase